MLVLFLRLLATKNIQMISSVLVVCVFFSIRFYTWQQNTRQVMQVTPYVTQKQHLLIYSDETKISGDLLTFKAWWWEKRQWVNGYYRIKTLAEKKTLLQMDKTKIWDVAGNVLPLQAPTNEAQFDWRRFYTKGATRTNGVAREVARSTPSVACNVKKASATIRLV